MGAYEVLLQAKGLISTPRSWCQHNFAVRANGQGTSAYDAEAVAWCALGAISKVRDNITDDVADRYLAMSAGMSVSEFNDTHTHEEVLAMFDRAIELARGHPPSTREMQYSC